MKTPRIKVSDEILGGAYLWSCQSQCRGYKNSHLPQSFRWFFLLSSPISAPPLSFHDCLQDFELKTNIMYKPLYYLQATPVYSFPHPSFTLHLCAVLNWCFESYYVVKWRVGGIFLVAGLLLHAKITHTHTHLKVGGLDILQRALRWKVFTHISPHPCYIYI